METKLDTEATSSKKYSAQSPVAQHSLLTSSLGHSFKEFENHVQINENLLSLAQPKLKRMYLKKNWQKEKILKGAHFQDLAYETVNTNYFVSRKGKEVVLENGKQYTEYMSCGYLGLDSDPRLLDAATQIQDIGITFPASRVRIQSACSREFSALLSTIFQGHAVTFQNLHVAHLGILPMIASGQLPSFPIKKNGLAFLIDQKAHASLQINRGLMQQFARVVILNVSDLTALECELRLCYDNSVTPIVIADGIGSMGEKLEVHTTFSLVERYEAYAYIDDAHGTSVIGKHGCGYVLDRLGYFHDRLILAASLSKAFGIVAGVVICKNPEDALMIRKFCPTYVFSGPLSYPIVKAGIASAKIHLSNELPSLQATLARNLELFDSTVESCKQHIINYGTNIPIRLLLLHSEHKTLQVTMLLKRLGILATAALYPTVELGKGAIRFAFASNHSQKQIEYLGSLISKIMKK